VHNPSGSFGSWLRHQREARGVSIREIADNSKISLLYLEALEQDRFDVLPAPVFARGFLREYARVVGLNPDEVVNLYLVAQEERAEGSQRAERPKSKAADGSSVAPSSLGYGLLLAFAVVVFVGIAALLSFLAERRNRVPLAAELVAPPTMTSAQPATPVASEVTAVAAESASTEAQSSRAPVVPGASGPGEAAPAVESFRVVLNFSQDCWVESVVDGSRRTSELKAAGETVQLEARQSVILTVGNSRAVTVEVDGVPFALPESATRVVRDLRIQRPERSLRDPGSSDATAVRP
jgi:cytoskeleton protein RodZ